ncbi:MAG: adenylate/guanylate cyclase domain-containing protein [Treponema sp.]|nr:adenylate/guanylate cyclase domain-containing protein [Treponema sp.]MCL2251046.1 adenylate/guanylate cyclase domain-containing protein [Treponema sp.]
MANKKTVAKVTGATKVAKKKKTIGKKLSALIITLLVFFVITGLHLLGVFHFLENKSYDMRIRFWANTSFSRPSDEIVVVLLDQDSLDWAQEARGWGWPWPRQAYAEFVDYMNLSGAKSVAFDVLFSEPSVYRNAKQDEIIDNAVRALEEAETAEDNNQSRVQQTVAAGRSSDRRIADTGQQRAGRSVNRIVIEALRNLSAREDDASFIDATEEYGHVVHTVMFSTQTGSVSSWSSNLNVPLFQPENFGPFLQRFSVGENEKAQFPIQGLREAAGALGSVTGIADSDGIIRRLKPFTLFDGRAIPGLSSASLLVSGKEKQLNFNSKTSTIDWGGISIPVDKSGSALLRYRGLLDKYIPYRAMDILLSYEAFINGDERYKSSDYFLSPENFNNTYVFFGFYAQGLYDIFSTPISSVYAGMGCHITMLDNMLQNDFLSESNESMNLIILLTVVVLIVFLTMFSNRITFSVGGMVIVILAIVIGAFAAYQFGNLWIPMITYLAGTLASFITVMLYNYATEGSQKRFIKSAFSQYLSPKVVDQLILDPSQLKLGGEKREMSAIFTDIRGFSTFSEALGDPAKLVELLNFYLTRMSNIVLDNQGTIDKYEGDAIIAFFGAPLHMKNHAALACRATVRMKKAETEINRDALALGLITPAVMEAMLKKGAITGLDDPNPIFTRLGINSGDMVVGNMGTPNKMDYTIMGNAVNLAARLEGVNKQYDTGGILISEYTRAQIGDEFVVRPLSRVRVVGVNTPIRLFELIDIANEASPELVEMVKSWEQAFNLYEKKDFLAAKDIFQTIFNGNNKDNVAKKYLKRCIDFLASPPADDIWDDGVDNLTEK